MSHRGDYQRHPGIAQGSLMELEALAKIAVRLKRTPRDAAVPVWGRTQDGGNMLARLIAGLRRPIARNPRPETRTSRCN